MAGKVLLLATVALLASGIFTSLVSIERVKASGPIYIRADGTVNPSSVPIRREGNNYTFEDNIYDEIIVQKANIIMDGDGYTVLNPRACGIDCLE